MSSARAAMSVSPRGSSSRVWGVASMFVLVSFAHALPRVPVLGHGRLLPEEILLAAAMAALLSGRRGSRLDWAPLAWGAPIFAAVLLSEAVSLPWYRVVPYGVREMSFVLALWLGRNAFRDAGERAVLARVLPIAVVAHCSLALVQETGGAVRPESTFSNPPVLAGYLLLLIPLLLAFGLGRVPGGRPGPREVGAPPGLGAGGWLTLVGLATVVLVTTLTRTALAGALAEAALVVWLWALRRGRLPSRAAPLGKAVAGAVLVALAVAPAALITVAPRADEVRVPLGGSGPERLFPGVTVREAVVRRAPIYAAAWHAWRDSFLIGAGGPTRYGQAVDDHLDLLDPAAASLGDEAPYLEAAARKNAHQLYLQIGVEYGVLGLIAFLALLACIGRRLSACVGGGEAGGWALGGLGILAGLVIQGSFDVVLPQIAVEAGLLLGASVAASSTDR